MGRALNKNIKERLEKLSTLDKKSGCRECLSSTASGYGQVSIKNKDGKWGTRRAHRVAYEEYVGVIPAGMFVCHKCDNRRCINPEHLFLGTVQDNRDDMMAKGREKPARGEKQHLARLTEEKVRLIKQLRSYGFTCKKIADAFGVERSTINLVVNGKTWRHVS